MTQMEHDIHDMLRKWGRMVRWVVALVAAACCLGLLLSCRTKRIIEREGLHDTVRIAHADTVIENTLPKHVPASMSKKNTRISSNSELMSKIPYPQTSTLLIFILALIAVSCKTPKSSLSHREKQETASLRSSRLCTSLFIDSIMQRFALNVDSLVFIFGETKDLRPGLYAPAEKSMPSPDAAASDDMYFFSGSPADKSAKSYAATQPSETDGAHTALPKPTALKVYGLHVDKDINKQSIQQTSSADSHDKSMQSNLSEEVNVKKSSPLPLKTILVFIILMAIAIWWIHKIRNS